MKLRHALSGAIYTDREDGTVFVEDPKSGDGLFEISGRWIRGELRHADPHLLGFVGGPGLVKASDSKTPRKTTGIPVPDLDTASSQKRKKGDMDLGLEGKRVLITAASRGIGFSTAQCFADHGCSVAICARGGEQLGVATADLEARGAKVFAQSVDVADGEALKGFVAAAGGALGGLDIYVANAIAGGGPGEAAWQANFEIDVMGAVRGVEASTPFLNESDAASVVFIGSTAALEFLGMPQGYNAMKAALMAHASDLSQALARQGIRVNVVSPGPVYFEGGNWEMIQQAMPAIYDRALAQCAIGRMGSPEEVARTVVFLASPAASLVTGANLVVDGGFTKRTAF